MAIQTTFDSQWNDPQMPRTVVTINNDSGSVSLPQGARLVLLNCSGVDVICQGNNEINCDNCSISSINGQKSYIRLTNSQSVGTVTANNCKFNCGGAQIEELDMTLCEVNLINCQVQQASYNQCDLTSIDNTYQEFTSNNNIINSENDQFGGSSTLSNNSLATFSTLQAQDITAQDSILTLNQPTLNGDLTSTDSQLTIVQGQLQGLTSTGEQSIVSMSGTQFHDQMELNDGNFSLDTITGQGKLNSSNANINGYSCTFQDQVQFDSCSVILVKCTLQDQLQLTDGCQARLDQCTLQDQLQLTDGALDSTNNTYEEIQLSNSSISSFSDTCTADSQFTELIGNNIFRSFTPSGNLTLSGDNGSTSILLDNVTGQDLDISEVTTVEVRGSTFSTAALSNLGTCIANSSTFSNCTASNVILLNTNTIGTMQVSDSTVIDQGSTINSTDCNLITKGSTVTASGGIVNATGGQVTGSDNAVVITKGADVTNTDGLTMGNGFSAENQGACILYDGTDLTIECTTGDINEISTTGDINETTEAGDINLNATGDIDMESTGEIDIDATGDVDISGADINLNE